MIIWGCFEIIAHVMHLHSGCLPEISACPMSQTPTNSEIQEVTTQHSCPPLKGAEAAGVTDLYFIKVT